MRLADLTAIAAPACWCGQPVRRVEQRWHLDEDGMWRLGPCFKVCAAGCRSLVRPFPPTAFDERQEP